MAFSNWELLGSLSKPRRRQQRERHQTKDLMNRTIAVNERYKSLYIFLPLSAKQQRGMTKFCVVYETWTTTTIFSYSPFGTKLRCCIFRYSTFSEPLAYQANLDNHEFRE